KKMQSILAYKTQFYDPTSEEPQTPISSKEFIDFLHGRMAEFGRSIGVQYGEGFTVERIPGVELLTDLI
ncbi:MAG: bacillithiol biosynthesis deacetylase BshB1, partial [Bacteroidetes bacterium]|nr:bacillithiol biosynthesis deacetylase BshB1 [Bacteroidota bacterium]